MTRRDFLQKLGVLPGALLALLALQRASAPASMTTPAIDKWPMFRRDAQHTGFTEGQGRVTGPSIKWQFPTSGAIEPCAAVGDIDGDGQTEVVISSFDGRLYAIAGSSQGTISAPKWSFQTEALIWSSPALGDVDGDGKTEVVVGSDDRHIYIIEGATGQKKWRFSTNARVRASPTLVDIDGDGQLEIIIGSDQIYALDGRARRARWAFRLMFATFSSAAAADIDDDGQLEVVVGSYDNILYALDGHSGALKWQFLAGNPIESSPALADIDGDGKIEVVFGQGAIDGPRPKGVYALRGQSGQPKWSFNLNADQRVISSPAIGDIDGDGLPEIVIGTNTNHVYALGGQGQIKYLHEAQNFVESSPVLGDIDGDGKIEVVVGSHDFKLYGLEAIPNQQRFRVEWTFTPLHANIFFSSATLADIDGDGLLEIVIGNNNSLLYALDGV